MPIYFCLSYLLGSWIWIVHFLLVRSRESFTFYWFAWSSFASALTRDRPTWWCHICRRTKVHNFGIEFWGMLIISYFLFAMASPCCKRWFLFGVWRLAFASKRCRAWNNKSTRWQTDKKKVGKGHHSFSMLPRTEYDDLKMIKMI